MFVFHILHVLKLKLLNKVYIYVDLLSLEVQFRQAKLLFLSVSEKM